MSDPLSIATSVVGLAATSAKIEGITKQLYSSARNAPTFIKRISEEMDQLHLIFGQVQMLLEGHAQKTLSRRGLTLLPLHHLITILSSCVLVHSSLDKKLSKVAGLAQDGGATTRSAGLGARV
ncbi:hypothetical protein EV426DRAFT_700252 [Tirmania nivea]|nr:hypothetical protein EV426DRAFT_700252 [Tirmania nivea]